MRLTPWEEERLLIFSAAELARRHRAAGLALNAPEAIALMCDAMLEAARAGASYAAVDAAGRAAVAPVGGAARRPRPDRRRAAGGAARRRHPPDRAGRPIGPRHPRRGRGAPPFARSRTRPPRASGAPSRSRARPAASSASRRTSRSIGRMRGSCSIASGPPASASTSRRRSAVRWAPGEKRHGDAGQVRRPRGHGGVKSPLRRRAPSAVRAVGG